MSRLLTYQTSVQNLAKIFSVKPGADVVLVAEVFAANDRSDKDDDRNRSWLSNKLTSLYAYRLITAVYTTDGQHKLHALKLTDAGKKALNELEKGHEPEAQPPKQPLPGEGDAKKLTIEDILEAVPVLRKAHPNWEIVFTVNPKQEDSAIEN